MSNYLLRSILPSSSSSVHRLSYSVLFSSSSIRCLTTEASYVLKRKVKLPQQPKPISPLIIGPFLRAPRYKELRPLADRIYEEVEQKVEVEPKLKLILLQTVDELGVAGDVVEVDRDYGRFHLLSARIAVYADEYNLAKYRELIESGDHDRSGPSSAFVMPTIKRLAREVIVVTMNGQNAWTLTENHVKVAFRAAGFVVPSECIKLPVTKITGPDVEELQGKDFAVTVTINSKEQVQVRCMLHHTGLPLRLDWDREPRFVALPEEQGELLKTMPVKEAIKEEEY